MINKIKDFLNRLTNRSINKTSDQEDFSDGDQSNQLSPDKTGEFKFYSNKKSSSFIEKLKNLLSTFSLKNTKSEGALLSPSLSRSIEKFLQRSTRESIHQIFLLAVVFGVTYMTGKLTALGIKGEPVINSARDFSIDIPIERDFNPNSLGIVKSINIFRTNTGVVKKKTVADTKCEKADRNSSLPIKLINTVVLQDSVKSLASVQIRGDRQLQELREGEQISNLAKIFKITRLELLVKNLESGACESITSDKARETMSRISVMSPAESKQFKLNKKMPGIENVGNKFNISKTLLDDKMKDIASILTQARALKIQNPDGSMSFKMTEIDPNGLFPYLGIQDQDIITSINGKPIYDMNEIMNLFGRIKNLDSLSLGIKREGVESVQDYSIKK